MALPSSGTITMGMIRTELKKTGAISLGSAECRKLAGVSSGAIKMSNFYGKSNSIKYENHIIYNNILRDSASINFPNTVISGTITVVVNFTGELMSTSGNFPSVAGQVNVNGNIIEGLETVTKEYVLSKGTKAISASTLRYTRIKKGYNSENYRHRLTVYFTGAVEA